MKASTRRALALGVVGSTLASCGPVVLKVSDLKQPGAELMSPAGFMAKTPVAHVLSRLAVRAPYRSAAAAPVEKLRESFGLPEAGQNFRLLLRDDNAVVSFDCDWGHAHWVSWTVEVDDLGQVNRSKDFHEETRLPQGCLSPVPEDYRGSGYDRGHMTPSGDRTSTRAKNDAVFSMANIVPQAPMVNQRAWNDLEIWTRARVRQGFVAIVYAGTTGSRGRFSASGINIPAATWKVVATVPVKAVTTALQTGRSLSEVPISEVAAAIFDNGLSNSAESLDQALTTVDDIEARTDVDLLSGLPDDVEARLEASKPRNPLPK